MALAEQFSLHHIHIPKLQINTTAKYRHKMTLLIMLDSYCERFTTIIKSTISVCSRKLVK